MRELCARAISASESECEQILAELRATIHEHVLFLQAMTAEMQSREEEVVDNAPGGKAA